MPIAEKLLPLCHDWCKGLFDEYVLNASEVHTFYVDVVEMDGIAILDSPGSESIPDCDLSFMPRKGDLGGHNFVAFLRRARLLNVSVEG